jgi:hypothetical protein
LKIAAAPGAVNRDVMNCWIATAGTAVGKGLKELPSFKLEPISTGTLFEKLATETHRHQHTIFRDGRSVALSSCWAIRAPAGGQRGTPRHWYGGNRGREREHTLEPPAGSKVSFTLKCWDPEGMCKVKYLPSAASTVGWSTSSTPSMTGENMVTSDGTSIIV